MSDQIDTAEIPEEVEPQETADDMEAAFEEFAADHDDSGFDDDDDEPEPVQQQPAAAPAAAAQSDDPLASLSAEELRHRLKSEAGRQAALQRKIADLEARSTAARPEPPRMPTTPKEWEDLKADYPEIATGIESLVNARLAPLQAVAGKVGMFEQERALRRRESEMAALQQAHPDFQQIASSDDFSTWVQQQPPAVQALRSSQLAADARWMLDLYKQQRGSQQQRSAPAQQLQARRKKVLETGQETPTHRRTPAPSDETDFDSAFEYFARKMERR